MSEPYWTPLGALAVDYEGAFDPAISYVPGDVVRYAGTDYLCVNPALGQTPPLVRAAALAATPGVGFPLDRVGLVTPPGALDDEFNAGPSLAAKWSLVGTAPAFGPQVAHPDYAPEGFYLGRSDTSQAALTAYLQALAVPATLYAKLGYSGLDGTNSRRGGIILAPANPTTASPCVYLGAFSPTAGGRGVNGIRYSSWSAFSANYGAISLPANSMPLWIKCRVLAGLTSYDAWASADGHQWTLIETGRAVGFTIGAVGLAFSMEGQTSAAQLTFDYFRGVPT